MGGLWCGSGPVPAVRLGAPMAAGNSRAQHGVYGSLWPSHMCRQRRAWPSIAALPTTAAACPALTGAGGAAGCSPHPRWCLLQFLQPLATVREAPGWHGQGERSTRLQGGQGRGQQGAERQGQGQRLQTQLRVLVPSLGSCGCRAAAGPGASPRCACPAHAGRLSPGTALAPTGASLPRPCRSRRGWARASRAGAAAGG